jgi:hypothetical protein
MSQARVKTQLNTVTTTLGTTASKVKSGTCVKDERDMGLTTHVTLRWNLPFTREDNPQNLSLIYAWRQKDIISMVYFFFHEHVQVFHCRGIHPFKISPSSFYRLLSLKTPSEHP